MKHLKYLSFLFIYVFSTLTFAQSDFTGGDDAGRLIHNPENQSLIDSFQRSQRDRAFLERDAADLLSRGTSLIDRQGLTVRTFEERRALEPSEKMETLNISANQEQIAPMRLYFDQIQLESSEVSEVTLKDGTVVTTRELQEFAKEVIKKKLNEQN